MTQRFPTLLRLPSFPLALLAAVALLLAPAASPAGAAPSRGVPQPRLEDAPPDPQPAASPAPMPAPAETPVPAEGVEPPSVGAAEATAAAGDEKKEEEPKWDVNAPPGPSEEVSIDVSEGTWMSLDVSPDGSEIAFDLLGDLYVIPIGGGEAKALTHDVAWQMQPRYSPDGKSIAFTSDEGGGDNLWIMDRDGANHRQVSKETFRLLNQPEWTPDGEYLVGRKHFTSGRSAGAGEMWIYHRSGGDGLQMTKRRTEQKDSGEPAFSPDGRYLYYSDDVTPGEVFEYNKDPNTEIYVIQRLDRATGETERYVTGPGGSVTPTPSPDGKSLAFVRRVRGKSVLFLRDIASGEEWPLWDGLDRDMQETWAIHGVYPRMSWTPDSRAVVLWAQGKIWRVGVGGNAVAEIPFHVRTTRRVTPALRFPVEVAPPTFHTRMLRWVETSPDGKRALFESLGKIWVRDLPDGAPRRLTRQEEHREVFPSFSRDGRSIVYATWDDRRLGTVRIAPAAGGEGRIAVGAPGHYVEPVLSPDGKQVVYRRVGGGYLRTAAWSGETGLYRVPVGGGEPLLLDEDGVLPHFGAASDRVFFLAFADEGKRRLASVGLDGRERREHLQSEWAALFRVSPDGRWVAFQERFHAYVAPFVATGKLVEIGPKSSALPVRRVTRDAGDSLHWSGDSRTLHWSLGPELFSLELKNAFAFLDGAPEKLPDPPATGRDLGFAVTADVPTGTVAVVGARLITLRGDEVIDDGTVVIAGNRIRAVGRRDQVTVPAGAHVIDGSGKTVIPGLVDVHWHGTFGTDDILPESNWLPAASLAFGLTTLHDPSNDTATIFAAAELQRSGGLLSPRIFSTGTILYGATTGFTAVIDSLEDAQTHLRRMKAVGAVSVKSYNQPRRDQRQQVIAAARETGMMVVPEGGSAFEHNMTMVVDGHTGVEHSIPVAAIYDDVRQLWGATAVGYTPTLGVAYGGLMGENYWYAHAPAWQNERLLRFVPREEVDPIARRRIFAPEGEWNHIDNARIAAELQDAGVGVQLGAHGQREGLAVHWELWSFVQGGMTPLEALRAGTLDGARYLGMEGDIGSLEPGKLADLVVLDRNPLEDIRNSESVRWVVLDGRVYDGMTLDEVGNRPRKREPFFWELPRPAFTGLPAQR